MISIEITLKCNSRWEQVSSEGVECCQSKFTSTFHLQPEHFGDRFGGYILEVYEEARRIGWKGNGATIYCPECDEVDQHYSEELSSLSVSIN
ncbi:hypothetical protein [uncultured Mediterranean phage uvMED]|nr:hypothetical protein [uncultured Mediterranean phage uvMED]